ncbi:hypothetical protein CFC21_058459 [Triticum aestivum]|uniref:TF-B3 domain-containing protein n=2 Tax=Triticum aestivum TaxID=4565 RepID=A0A9R1GMB0_WHEAT|nr:hypothetical protein CFC21_058459 [Triticum aestivum]
MEEEKAFPIDSSGFEFFIIMLSKSLKKLRMPDKFAKVLAGREPREVKLREAGSGRRSLWDVKVVLDADGHMYLGRGWEQFARAHDLRLGYFLVFSFDGDAVLTVKVFDMSMCRRHYQRDDDASTGGTSSWWTTASPSATPASSARSAGATARTTSSRCRSASWTAPSWSDRCGRSSVSAVRRWRAHHRHAWHNDEENGVVYFFQ